MGARWLIVVTLVAALCLVTVAPVAAVSRIVSPGPGSLVGTSAPVSICDNMEEFSLSEGLSLRLDLDGDGTPESVAITMEPAEVPGEAESQVRIVLNAFDPALGQVVVAGEEVFPASFYGRPTALACIWTGDLTGDGQPELLVSVTTQFFVRNVERGTAVFQYARSQAWTIWKELLQPTKMVFTGTEIQVEETWTWQAGLCVRTRNTQYRYDGEVFRLAAEVDNTRAQGSANCS